MPESQQHGFAMEAAIKTGPFKNTTVYSRTAAFDIPACDNCFDSEENISIKTSCGKRVECSDVLRIFDYQNFSKVTLIAVKLKQKTPTTKQVMSVYELALGGPAAHKALFGDVGREEILAFIATIHALPADLPRIDSRRGPIHTEKERLNVKSGAMRFNPKIGSGNHRLQGSIPDLEAFVKAHPTLLISKSTEPVLRGCAIPATLESTPRQRKKKVAAVAATPPQLPNPGPQE